MKTHLRSLIENHHIEQAILKLVDEIERYLLGRLYDLPPAGWISVEERPIPSAGHILVFCAGRVYYRSRTDRLSDILPDAWKPTHWMPINHPKDGE